MPEFVLDYGTAAGARAFKALDGFGRGYVEAMFFTSTGHLGDGDLEDAAVSELSDDAWSRIWKDIRAFQEGYAALLEEAYASERVSYDDEQAGRDFWYTRNGYGVGFWDRGLGPVGDRLTERADAFGSIDLYRGDDGCLHLA